MCDTMAAVDRTTARGTTLFGKNSDRQRNEAQAVEIVEEGMHVAGEWLKCTYVAVPQVARTNRVLLCRPYWMWGVEMGANEHGVAIGNEGLEAQVAASVEPALTGMDLIRLALERAASAAEAITVMTELLEQYGQGGNCGHIAPRYYQNGFIVADPVEAFVLETVGRDWVVARIETVRAISNIYSIGTGAITTSPGARALTGAADWTALSDIDFAASLAHPDSQHIGQSPDRMRRAQALLEREAGRLTALDVMRILRVHTQEDSNEAFWDPETATRFGLCLHAGSNVSGGQTVGSLVSDLHPGDAIHWVTASSAPCLSVFRPVLLSCPCPPGLTPEGRVDESRWWRAERRHRRALARGLFAHLKQIHTERDQLEDSFAVRIEGVLDADTNTRAQAVSACWVEADAAEVRWDALLGQAQLRDDTPFHAAWSRMSAIAGLDDHRT